jgi:hypothetical protein
MLTYHDDETLRQSSIEKSQHHRDFDLLIAGTYCKLKKKKFLGGCSVGCDAFDITGVDVEEGYHEITSDFFGFPLWFERWRDRVFEGLPEPERYDFHPALKIAVPKGFDIDKIKYKMTIKRLSFLQTLKPVVENKAVFKVLQAVIDGCVDQLADKKVDWMALHKMARAAATATATATAAAAATATAAAAAAAAANDAATAAVNDAAAAAEYAYAVARKNFWRMERDWMMELLGELK